MERWNPAASMNIKDDEAVRLIEELAELEGESMTTVVIGAVRDRLDRKRRPRINEERVGYWLGRRGNIVLG